MTGREAGHWAPSTSLHRFVAAGAVGAIAAALDGFAEMDDWLWWLAVAFFGIGDLMTTGAATFTLTVSEGSPIVDSVLHAHGIGGLLVLKLFTFGIAYGVWRVVDEPHDVGVPLALSVLGVGLTTWNLFVLAAEASG